MAKSAPTPGPWYVNKNGDIEAACIHNSILVHGSHVNGYDVQNPAYSNPKRLLAEDDGGAANIEHIVSCVNARPVYNRLHDMLSDMIEGGRLREVDIPDDYRAIVELLAEVANV